MPDTVNFPTLAATEAQSQAGVDPVPYMSPLSVTQRLATAAQAIAGTDSLSLMSPLRTAEAIEQFPALYFVSIATLRLFAKATIASGTNANVLGWSAGSLLGGGVFRYDSTDQTGTDNGGTIITDAQGRKWKRVLFGTVDLDMFGASGGIAPHTAMTNALAAGHTYVVLNSAYTWTAGFSISSSRITLDFRARQTKAFNGPLITSTGRWLSILNPRIVAAGATYTGNIISGMAGSEDIFILNPDCGDVANGYFWYEEVEGGAFNRGLMVGGSVRCVSTTSPVIRLFGGDPSASVTGNGAIVGLRSAGVLLDVGTAQQLKVSESTFVCPRMDYCLSLSAITDGGSNYTALDVLTLSGGTGDAATIRVDTVDGSGAILSATVTFSGRYTVAPSNPVSVTGGTGTGATFTMQSNLSSNVKFLGCRITDTTGKTLRANNLKMNGNSLGEPVAFEGNDATFAGNSFGGQVTLNGPGTRFGSSNLCSEGVVTGASFSGSIDQGDGFQSISNNSTIVLTPFQTAKNVEDTAPLTQNRNFDLADAYKGARFNVHRTGSGAFLRRVRNSAGTILASLDIGDYYSFEHDGSDPVTGWKAYQVSPRCWRTGGIQGTVTDQTPVATEVYICEIFVPADTVITGVAVFNGSAASGNYKVGLASATGLVLATSVSTAMSGTGAFQRVPFTAKYFAKASTYYVLLFVDNTTARINAHSIGNFGAAVQTGQVYATGFTTITPPTTFTADVGTIANLY